MPRPSGRCQAPSQPSILPDESRRVCLGVLPLLPLTSSVISAALRADIQPQLCPAARLPRPPCGACLEYLVHGSPSALTLLHDTHLCTPTWAPVFSRVAGPPVHHPSVPRPLSRGTRTSPSWQIFADIGTCLRFGCPPRHRESARCLVAGWFKEPRSRQSCLFGPHSNQVRPT